MYEEKQWCSTLWPMNGERGSRNSHQKAVKDAATIKALLKLLSEAHKNPGKNSIREDTPLTTLRALGTPWMNPFLLHFEDTCSPWALHLGFWFYSRERPSPRSYLLAVTILALSLNARKFAEFKYDADRMSYETTSVMEYPTYIIISNTWQELFVTGLLPFVALVYCNIRIYCKIRESSKHEKYR